MVSFCGMVLQFIGRVWAHGLVHVVLLVQECGHGVGGKCDGKLGRVMFLFFKLVCCSWGIQRLGILKSMWCVFPRRVGWVRVCSVVA